MENIMIYETEMIDKLFLELAQFTTAKIKRDPDFQEKYNELIMTVATKHPGESRHQTALRYIKNAEIGSNHKTASQDN